MSRALTCCLAVLAMLAAAPPAWVAPEKPAVNLFEDASDLAAQLKNAIPGRVMIQELTLYHNYAILDIQDPKRKENIDRWTYRDGKLGEPEPVKMSGDYTQADLDSEVFPLESIDLKLIPTMIQDAKERLKMPEGKNFALSLKRGRPFNEEVRWRVGMSDERHTGSVEYDLKGRKKSIVKD
jgi:hypothetical protein